MRAAIVGAGGHVGSQALQQLVFENEDADLELVLLGRTPDRIRGVVADIVSALPLVARHLPGRRPPRITITSDLRELRRSDVVVLTAAQWPSPEEEAHLAPSDPTGRLVQAYANASMVADLSRAAAAVCPEALFLVVTNQSDLMADVARRKLPAERVLGFGGIVDSARLRTLLAEGFGLPAAALTAGNHIVGYHNYDLIPLASSLTQPLDEHRLSKMTDDVRRYGEKVSRLKKGAATTGDFGANVLPGCAVHAALSALLGHGEALEESFNVCLPAEAAALYGTRSGAALSVPVRLERCGYAVVTSYAVAASERSFLAQAQQTMDQTWAQFER